MDTVILVQQLNRVDELNMFKHLIKNWATINNYTYEDVLFSVRYSKYASNRCMCFARACISLL
jgi:hypothetical protein